MSEYTPGPWAANGPEEEIVKAVCSLGDGWCVVASEANPHEHEVEADARLIAAAPELLMALKVIAVWAENQESDATACLKLIHDKAMNCIAKATEE